MPINASLISIGHHCISGDQGGIDRHWEALIGIEKHWEVLIDIDCHWSTLIFIDRHWSLIQHVLHVMSKLQMRILLHTLNSCLVTFDQVGYVLYALNQEFFLRVYHCTFRVYHCRVSTAKLATSCHSKHYNTGNSCCSIHLHHSRSCSGTIVVVSICSGMGATNLQEQILTVAFISTDRDKVKVKLFITQFQTLQDIYN